MIDVYLSLGSNLKLPRRQIKRAVHSLATIPKTKIIKASHLYLSKAYGISEQPDFLNLNLFIQTDLNPEELFSYCQLIEKKQGRIRKKIWGARVIDIDVLIYGDLEQATQHLTIPHEELGKRDFFIKPLLDINPDLSLPNGEKLSDCLNKLKDYYILNDLGEFRIM